MIEQSAIELLCWKCDLNLTYFDPFPRECIHCGAPIDGDHKPTLILHGEDLNYTTDLDGNIWIQMQIPKAAEPIINMMFTKFSGEEHIQLRIRTPNKERT